MSAFIYLKVNTIGEVLSVLEQYGERAAPLAGGSDLLLALKQGRSRVEVVVPLKGIRELSGKIETRDDGLYIGALATLSEVSAHYRVRADYQALAEAAGKVGSRQVRNWATLAGNICHASPAADTAPALLVFNAEVKTIGRAGRRTIPITEFFIGPNKTALLQGEIVEGVYLPSPSLESSSSYFKTGRREGVDLAIIGVAVLVNKNGETRIAVGAAGPTAFRAYQAEKTLREGNPTGEILERALRKAAAAASPLTDLRASAEYRLAMIEVLTRRALETARGRLD